MKNVYEESKSQPKTTNINLCDFCQNYGVKKECDGKDRLKKPLELQ